MYQDRNFFIKSSGAQLVTGLTFLFVLFWALNFHLVQFHNFSPGQARISYCSDARKKGHRLNATVYDDRHSLSRIDCVVQCVYEQCCRSINYRKRDPFNGKENCELLHAVASEQPAEDLKEDKDYDYEILLEPNKPFDCHCSSCKNNGSCETSKKLCSCGSGFNGTQCEKDVNECGNRSNSCHQNSTCNNTVGSYTCTCHQGFTGNGDNCTDVDECSSGSNHCDQNSTCNNTIGSYTCTCNPGFTGNGTNCTDVDECSSIPCYQNSTCKNTLDSYTCTCNQGFAKDGDNCKDVNECSSNPCHPNSTCNNTVGSYTCTCNEGFTGNGDNCTVPKNCADLYKNGVNENGVYIIDPDGEGAFNVSCDMTTDGGGWTVFQRRMDGSVDFYRVWADYKNGFGNRSGEFWLGLDKINRLTESGQDVLRVDLEDFENETRYAKYNTFAVADEVDHEYQLKVEDYLGNAGNSLDYHNGMKFSTKDKDNDRKWNTGNCAVEYKGAWWYKHCHYSNLNGLYLRGTNTKPGQGVIWGHWKGRYYSLKKSEMKVRPRHF